MKRSFGQLLTLLEEGASIEVSALDWSFGHLLTLIDEAKEGGGTLTIADTDDLSFGQIKTLNDEGKGHVVIR